MLTLNHDGEFKGAASGRGFNLDWESKVQQAAECKLRSVLISLVTSFSSSTLSLSSEVDSTQRRSRKAAFYSIDIGI